MKRTFKFRLVDGQGKPIESGAGVYFIGTRGFDEACKIGMTDNLSKRARAIQACCPLPVFVHALVPCKRFIAATIESFLHDMHLDARLNDEWFRLSPEARERAIEIARKAVESTAEKQAEFDVAAFRASQPLPFTRDGVTRRRRLQGSLSVRQHALCRRTYDVMWKLRKEHN